MFRRQVWMANNDDFDHIVDNLQRVLKLSAQYEDHPYVEVFTKEYSIMFVFVTNFLEGETDVKFSLSEIWNLLQDVVDPLPDNASIF